jgi:hypothetical protein
VKAIAHGPPVLLASHREGLGRVSALPQR